jgi:hypothetical protein
VNRYIEAVTRDPSLLDRDAIKIQSTEAKRFSHAHYFSKVVKQLPMDELCGALFDSIYKALVDKIHLVPPRFKQEAKKAPGYEVERAKAKMAQAVQLS